MSIPSAKLRFIVILVLFQDTTEYRFMRRIQAVGYPYYKIMMALGACKERILFTDQKIWGKVPMNRVLDIYYKSGTVGCTVSRVEIMLIINSTNTIAFSEGGVGHDVFFGTLYLPLHIGFVIYHLGIFTCSHTIERTKTANSTEVYLPFYRGTN